MTNTPEQLASQFMQANARPIEKLISDFEDSIEDFIFENEFPKFENDTEEQETLDALTWEIKKRFLNANFEGMLSILSDLPAIPLDAWEQIAATLKEHFPNS